MGGTAADSWAPSATALISAIAAQIAGPTTAGLTYPAETNPFTNDEFKKTPYGFPSLPSRKFSSAASSPDPGMASIGDAAAGEASPCRLAGTADISCGSSV